MSDQICTHCGGDNIGRERWVNPNTNEVLDEFCASELEWCFGECQGETTIIEKPTTIKDVTFYLVTYISEDKIECITNNFDKWFKEHNKERISNGFKPEQKFEFNTEEVKNKLY